MPGATVSRFACGTCGKKHVWKQEHIGKRGKCACGQIVVVPGEPESAQAPADDLYDIAEPAPVAKPVNRIAPLPAAAVAAVPAAATAGALKETAYVPTRRPVLDEPQAPPREPNLFRDVLLPIVLVAMGVYLCFYNAMYIGPDYALAPFRQVLLSVSLQIVASLALVLGAVYVGSYIAGIAFEDPIWMTILKFCAVSLAPGAVGGIVDHWLGGINGNMAGVFASVALYFLLLWMLIKLTIQDYVVLVALVWIIRAFIMYMAFRIQGAKQGSDI